MTQDDVNLCFSIKLTLDHLLIKTVLYANCTTVTRAASVKPATPIYPGCSIPANTAPFPSISAATPAKDFARPVAEVTAPMIVSALPFNTNSL